MTPELNLSGVYIHPLLLAAVLAFVAGRVIELLLAKARLYRFIWHRGLFDVAMSLVLWGAFARLLTLS
jgi:hypothetical protein